MKNSLGKFLYQIRILNGFDNISEYLRIYPMPLSGAYYRDLEAGKKTLSLEKTIELIPCLKLPKGFNQNDIFYHLFSDLLPKDIVSDILKPRNLSKYENLSELLEIISHDVKINQQSYLVAKLKSEQTYIGDDVDIEFLDLYFEFLPVLHYIYMSENVTRKGIETVCKKNCIPYPNNSLEEYLNNICLIGNDSIKRKNKIFRIKKSEKGVLFKKKFFLSEISKSQNKEQGYPFEPYKHFENNGIYSIPKNKIEILKEKLTSLLSEIDLIDSDLEDSETSPFFISLITSGRFEYDPK